MFSGGEWRRIAGSGVASCGGSGRDARGRWGCRRPRGRRSRDRDRGPREARRRPRRDGRAALVTGGHGAEPVDHLFDSSRHLAIPVARFGVAATHGAGCTHSAALAAGLAAWLSLTDAAEQAAAVAGDAVAHGLAELGGQGPVNVLHDLAPVSS